ncbi:MAG: S9 family peptidase, partial [Planctomycetota bacterium]
MNFRFPFLLTLFVAILCLNPPSSAQQDLTKRQLEHSDYDVWNTMAGTGISSDGKWAMFVTLNGAADGEATVTFRGLDSGKQYVVERGSTPSFTWDSKFALFRVTPPKKKLKQLRKAKTKSADLPKAKFQILELESG